MAIVPILLNGRKIKPHKTIIDPLFKSRSVLTNSPWEFVELWLKRNKKHTALFYWNQAKHFSVASAGLPTQSAPLLHYYSFMNASKALLSAKNQPFDEIHGIKSHNIRRQPKSININNEGVKILTKGIFPALSQYLCESETVTIHSLQEILFNLPYIHRTYCLSYPTQPDMFIPIMGCEYVYDTILSTVFLRAKLSADIAPAKVIQKLPINFLAELNQPENYILRSRASIAFSNSQKPTSADLVNLQNFHRSLREDLVYISGNETLWYIKGQVKGPKRLSRHSLTLTLSGMHRLSELVRYRPVELSSYLSGQKNWLLSEFINQSSQQFLDEIASEITGHQFLTPNVRPAS